MFGLNEKVVYPGHGVALIVRLVEKTVGGNKTIFYELRFYNKEMTILVPMTNIDTVGIRRLSSIEHIKSTFERLCKEAPPVCPDFTAGNWSRRNKKYKSDLSKGSLDELCKIYRDLHCVSLSKELSFGEKSLLQQAEFLIAQEISLVNNIDHEKAIEQLRLLFGPFFRIDKQSRNAMVARSF